MRFLKNSYRNSELHFLKNSYRNSILYFLKEFLYCCRINSPNSCGFPWESFRPYSWHWPLFCRHKISSMSMIEDIPRQLSPPPGNRVVSLCFSFIDSHRLWASWFKFWYVDNMQTLASQLFNARLALGTRLRLNIIYGELFMTFPETWFSSAQENVKWQLITTIGIVINDLWSAHSNIFPETN